MIKPLRAATLALLLAGSAFPGALTAQQGPGAGGGGDIVVNMRGVEIAAVAEQISRLTGRTLILDPTVKGVVTVTSAQPLSADGVWELFQSVLRANGFAAVRSGRAWRIVPQANAVRDGGAALRRAGGSELVTRMIRLSNVPAGEAARVVRPLIAQFGSVEPLTSPNAIVVTDYADNVRRIEAIVGSLDGGSGATFATVVLQNGSAAEVAQALEGVLGSGNDAGATRVAADVRSNAIIIRGTPNAVAEARRITSALDRPGGATPITRVFRLNFADAESVTEVLRGVLGQEAVTNPVAQSLRSSSTSGRAGSGYRSPTAALSQLVNGGGNSGLAAAALQGVQNQTGSGGFGNSTANFGEGSQPTATPQGFSTPDLTVQPAPDINAIVVRGTPSAVAGIETIVADLDVRRPQVLIEAAIAEVTGDQAEALAIQFGSAGAALTSIEGVGTSLSGVGTVSLANVLDALGVPAAGLLGEGLTANIGFGNDFSVLVQALSISSKANLLSTPQLTTLDNKAGEIVVAQEVPFITGSILTNNADATPYTSVERKDVGITLRVLPRINAGDTIRLEVQQEASSIAATQLTSATDIITNKRSINTTVLADDGQTIVLGGLINDDYNQTKSQVPILGDVPILGELFRNRRENRTKRTLFVFLKPTILRDGVAASAAAQGKYARLRAGEIEQGRDRTLLIGKPKPPLRVELEGIY